MSNTANTLLISIWSVLLLIFIGNLEALSWTVRFRSYEANSCFYINVSEPGQTISIYYNVHESKSKEVGHLVDYVVSGPNNQQLMAEQGLNYKDFKVQPVMAGRHSICFKHNGSPTEKILDIDVSLLKSEASIAASSGQGSTELTGASPTAEVERVNRRVKEDLSNLYHSLLSMKDREKGNHGTVKSILSVIKWFSIFQSFTVIALGFAHVYVLKTFFSNNAKTRV